jgi:RNA polymerase sigma factor (sigma-70 family)
MPAHPIHGLVPRLKDLVSAPSSQASDRELLHRFSSRHDEAAFAEIVRRHGPMLLRVCQRVLHDAHGAEDVAQAAFLLLAQKADSVRWHDSAAGWLYQTAYRLSLKARTAAGRRLRHEARAKPLALADPLAELTVREMQAVLDEELNRLPEKYRSPIVLCCLEGRSRDEAAGCLGLPLGVVKDRLERGREHLRSRLARRGVLMGTALTAAWLLEGEAVAGLSPQAIARDALSLITARSTLAGLLPPHVAALARGGITTMFACRLTLLAASLALALGIAAAVPRAPDEKPRAQPQSSRTKPASPNAAAAKDDAPPRPAVAALVGHKGAVNAVAFARSGKLVATAGADGTVRVWNLATGDQVYALKQPGKPAGVAFSPDDRLLAAVTLGKDGEVRVWDTAGGKLMWRDASMSPTLNPGPGGAVAFSPDGKLLAAGKAQGVTMVFQAVAGRAMFGFHTNRGGATAVAWAPDGKRLVSGDRYGSVQVNDAATGQVLLTTRRKGAVTALVVLPDGTKVAVADGSKGLRMVEIATGKETTGFENKETVNAVAVSPDGKRLATAGAGGTILLWDPTGRQERPFSAGGPIAALAFSPDGKRLATAGANGVLLWDLTRDEKPLPPDFKLSAKDLDARWADLARDDGGKVYAAVRLLRADPARSVPFLQKRLAPKDDGPDPKKVKQLIADLDSDEFDKRDAATKELERLGHAVESQLRDALAANPSLELTRRVERLLKRLEEQRQSLTAEQQRDVRAVRVLEQVATPEARKLLQALSKKGAGWWVEREAKEALGRLTNLGGNDGKK